MKDSDLKNERIDIIIQKLADGEFHSGEQLGKALGVSRAAIWKYIKSLEDLGLIIDSVRGRGYCISGGLNFLDANLIKNKLSLETKRHLNRIDIFRQIDSTNQYLLEKIEAGEDMHGCICLAEQQSAGRGRRGREWVSPFGQNIYCSLVWHFEKGMQALEGLSLVVALSIVHAMKAQNIAGLSLKWPNDILGDGKKMAGILLEVRGDLTDYSDVVIGFGINVGMTAEFGQLINQDWIDTNQLSGRTINRNELLPPILDQLFIDLKLFEDEGFRVFRQRWNNLDGYMGGLVKIIAGKDVQQGIERGVNEHGALLLEIDGIVKAFHGGELSLRGVDEALV